jgi:WD40 repeat protein/beta-lactamase regulating signal transducer with metallopeptidase domain
MNLTTDELVPILFRTTALLALAVLVVRALLARRRPASPALWRVACVLSLLQGVLFVRLSVPVPWAGKTMAATSSFTKAERQATAPAPRPTPSQELPQSEEPASRVAVLPSQVGGTPSIDRTGWTWSGLLVAGWVAGMAGLIANLLIGYVQFIRGLRTRPPEEPAWAEEWSSLQTKRGIRHPLPLRVTDQLGPMLCRLPAGYQLIVPAPLWRRLDPSERQSILRHELAHYTRGDLWKSLAIRALALPHWFNPCAWWSVRTFDECGEWACDDVATGSDPSARTAYARALLQLVEPSNAHRSFGFSARGSALGNRVRRLLQLRPRSEPAGTRLLVVGVLIALAAVQLIRPELMARPTAAVRSATDLHGDPLPPGALARLGTVRLRPGAIIERLAFAADGKTLACWDGASTLSLFEPMTGKPIRRHHFPICQAYVLTYLPNGKSVAVVGSSEEVVHLWDFADERELVPRLGAPTPGRREVMAAGDDRENFATFAVSSDGRLLAGGSSGFGTRPRMIWLWELATAKRLDELKPVRDFERRPDSVIWIAFSADGRTLFSVNGNPGSPAGAINKGGKGILYTWDVASGAETHRFEIPLPSQQGNQSALAVSPDGRLLAVGTPAKQIHLIRLADGSELRQIGGLEAPTHSLAFSPDGTTLLSGGRDNAARAWDVATGRPLREPIKHRMWVEAVAITSDGRIAASGGQDNRIRIWNMDASKDLPELPAHEFWLSSVAVSPDGATVITSAFDDTTRLWDAVTGRQRHVIHIPDRSISNAISPDGQVLAVSAGRPGAVRLLDAVSGRELRRMDGHTRGVFLSLAFSRDGSRIVACGGDDQTVRLWDAATGRSLWIMKHEAPVRTAAISPDGAVIAAADSARRNRLGPGDLVRIWDTATGRQIRELRGHKGSVNSLAFSPDSKQLATAGISTREEPPVDGRAPIAPPDFRDAIHLWDVATGTDLRQFPGEAAEKWVGRMREVNAVAFTPDGRTLISGEESGSIVLYDASNSRVRATLRGHLNGVRAVCVSPDGRRFVSASADLTALVWDLSQALESRKSN